MIEPISYGWQCPICKRVYSPRQEMCLYCGKNSISSPITSSKPIHQGGEISGDTINYCDDSYTSTRAINTDSIRKINGTELKTTIENSEKEKFETTVRASAGWWDPWLY